MINHHQWNIESATQAYQENRLQEWCVDYLKHEGNNLKLAEVLENLENKVLVQSLTLEPLDSLNIQVGPPGSNRKWTDNDWEYNISKFIRLIDEGWVPPPIITTDFWGNPSDITDGNHRCEALRRKEVQEYWVIQLSNKAS
ncbi:MAG: hypothetical protein R3B38_01325 [Patescibacteria group bacterium]